MRTDFDNIALVSRAFDLRRAMIAHQDDVIRQSAPLNNCDLLLLSLIVDLLKVASLSTEDEDFAARLSFSFDQAQRNELSIVCPEEADDRNDLRLCAYGDVLARGAPLGPHVIVYGVPRMLPCSFLLACGDRLISIVAAVSPAAWSSSLIWMTWSEHCSTVEHVLSRVRDLTACDRLDPLALTEKIEAIGTAGRTSKDAGLDLVERCRVLEQRVRELETSGLVRCQALLDDVSDRWR